MASKKVYTSELWGLGRETGRDMQSVDVFAKGVYYKSVLGMEVDGKEMRRSGLGAEGANSKEEDG